MAVEPSVQSERQTNLLLPKFAHRTKNNLQSRGTRVMQLLVEQLRGTIQRQDTDPGCKVIVEMMVRGEDAP